MNRFVLLFCLIASSGFAQQQAAYILLGSPTGTLGSGAKGLQPRPGFAIGLDYWFFNAKGNAWSLGASYNFFKRKNDTQKETFEYLTVRAMPLVWHLDNKKKWYFEIGAFGNYLLHQESESGGSVLNSTKFIQRTYLGPSAGFGVLMGQAGKTQLLLGLRDDFGAIGFGKGIPVRFNTVTLFAGLEL